MWQKIIQYTITALIDAIAVKLIGPLIKTIKESVEKRKRKKESQKKLKEHKDAKTKKDQSDSFNKLP